MLLFLALQAMFSEQRAIRASRSTSRQLIPNIPSPPPTSSAAVVTGLAAMTAERDRALADRDQTVAGWVTMTAERDRAVAGLAAMTADRDRAAAGLAAMTADRGRAVAVLEGYPPFELLAFGCN